MARKRSALNSEIPTQEQPAPEEWKSLRKGDRVTLRLNPGFETGGHVDAVTHDYTVVWVTLDDGRGRQLVHSSDGVEIVLQEA
ncbi:hypothetical protein [Arthrobacter sp. M4]|uniref:hypothetical protein n=1 Tax=Arthrobacter sp. M4 TaxID=218160 RepID=UPI001CDB6946|nr:hypothetical protein [Arthrobacter sp. M4]MCA4133167.1 hypothetical protein [Arthrobacter sp. M4]